MYSALSDIMKEAKNRIDFYETDDQEDVFETYIRVKPEAAADSLAGLEAEDIGDVGTTVAAKPRKSSVMIDLLMLLAKIASIGLVFTMLFTFLFGFIRYPEPSMAPAIKDGDLVIFHRYVQRGYLPRDVIAFDYNGQRIVRRVAATAGDIVDITERGLVINGAPQQEAEIYTKTEQYQEGVSFPLEVPEGHVFVLSDDRPGATDSRIFGCIKIEDTLGKVMAVMRRRGL